MDVLDLKLIPLSGFHTEYITRKIEKDELIRKVKEFEKSYDIDRKPYPVATEEQLNELILFLKTEKQGFISARVTTLFELLRNFRSFTLCQLEFRSSSEKKQTIIKILKKIPMLLSKSALTRRLRNSGHIELNASDKSETFISFHEMFKIAKKLGLNNIESQCALLRRKHPKLFQNQLYDKWCIDHSNFVQLIIKCQNFKEVMKTEIISKLLGACYNTDRYMRYQTNHPVNEMNLMGSYYADSMYSYKIKRVRKSASAIERSPVQQLIQKNSKPLIPENSTEIDNPNIKRNILNSDLDNSSTNMNHLKKQIDCNLNSSDDMAEFNFEGFDFMNVELEKERNSNIHGRSPTSQFQEIFVESTNTIDAEILKKDSPSYLSNEKEAHKWTKKDAIDRNFEISLKRMKNMGWNDQLLFVGDEMKILINFVQHMNLSKQSPGKALTVIQIMNEREEVILGCENGANDRLVVEVQSMKISKAELNDKLLKDFPMPVLRFFFEAEIICSSKTLE